MKQLKQLLMVMAIALTGFTPAQAQYTHYSEWIANSRNYKVYKDGYTTFDNTSGNNGDFWRYDDGLMYEAILDTYHRYNTNTSFLEGVQTYLKWCFNGDKSPWIGKLKEEDLDDMRPGRLVWKYVKTYEHTDNNVTTTKYNDALSALMGASAFSNTSRVTINGNTGKGYPWQHKESTAKQVWLDGIFMGLPFWTLAGPVIGSSHYSEWTTTDFFEDAVSQIQKTDERTYEPTIGLWAHAWDAEGDEYWSQKNGAFTSGTFKDQHTADELIVHDGRSSHCWGRALGWYAMAIMETMDNIQLQNGTGTYNTQINTLKELFKKVMDKVIETRDPSSGVWYCVLDVGDNSNSSSPYYGKGSKNNYLEATCSSMFAYCLLHGVAQGYLDNSYKTIAQDVYNSVVTQFIRDDSSNKKLISCDKVAGLGTNNGTNRDGSFAYYMSESKIDNDSKGVGPFIWASLAAETTPYNYTISTGFPSISNDGIVQFRWSKVADNITNPSSYTSPTFTAKTYGNDTPLTNSTDITFVSDNTKVATVDDNGTITLAGEAGTANIKATMKSGAYVGEAIYTVTTTGTDTTKPTLSSSTPTTGATDVAVSGNIVLTFSEDVTINDASNITLTGGAGTLNTASATVDGATITIPYSGLANSTTYTLSVAADAVKDGSNNTNDALSNITFTTIAADETAPKLNNQSIANNAPNVSTSGTIVLTFSEAVTVANAAGITISPTTGVTWGTATVDGTDNKKVNISYSGLTNETSYTVTIANNAVTDLAGNAYAGSNFSFTTSVSGTVEGSAGSSYLNIAQYTTIGTEGFDNSVENLYSYDSTNGVLVMIVYASQNSPNQKWITSSSVENTSSSWTSAPSPFKSSDFYKGSKSSTPKQAKVKSGSNITYKVTNCTKVSLYGKAGGSSEKGTIISAYIIDAEGNISNTASKTATISSTSNASVVLDGLISTEKYAIVITGENSSTAGYAYEIAFYTPNSTPSTFTLNNTVNTSGYGTVSPTTVANIPSGTAVTAGTGDNINKYTVGETTVTATPATATAEYTYAFSGWSGLPATVSANATVTANFTRTAKEYTLAWNSNGGSALSGDYTYGTVAFGTAITAPNNPTRDGYTFNGWKSAQDGSGTAPTGTMPAANTTYYAQWTENTLPTAPEFSPEEGNVNGGTEVSITSTDATTIYYQISESSTPLAIGNSGWSTYSSAVVLPNITGTRYLHAYGANATGNSTVSTAIYTLTENAGGGGSTTATYTFDDGRALATDWDVTTTVPSGGNAVCEITQSLSGAGFSPKNNNYLGLAYLNKGDVGITVTTKATYSNITEISIDAVAGDNGKPTFAAYIVTASGDEEVFAAIGSKDGFETGGTNKWGKKTVTLATPLTGKLKIVTTASSSGKYAALDNIAITTEGGASTKVATPAITGTTSFITNTDVTISCGTAGATIYYTTNGDTPTTSSTEYSAPFNISATTTVKAIAVKDGMTESDVATQTFTKSDNISATITYTLDVTESEDKEKTDINSTNVSTSALLGSLIGITNNTGGNYTKGSKANLTVKIPTDATYNAGHYMSVGFTVAEGYQFKPTSISVKAQPVTTAKSVKLVLTDGTNTIEKEQESLAAGSITEVKYNYTGDTEFTGNVTLKIYCYGANDTYRLGSPITISGTVSATFTPRTTTATIKANKRYATYNTTMDIDFDQTEGLQAFIVDDATKSSVHLTEVHKAPASTALILKGDLNVTATDYTLYETNATTDNVTSNLLTISNSTVAADNMYYALGTVNGVQGFHRVQNGLTIPTSYVIITDQTAKSFLNFEEEENIATGIDGFATDNGFIVIDDNTPLYNLSGQRVSKSYKGIVIINGKKVLRK